MKIATYNLHYGGKASERIDLWNQIFAVVDPDIFLIQEMCHTEKYMSAQYDTYCDQIHWIKTSETNWGTAVFVRSGKIKPIIIPPEFGGYLVGVTVDGWKWSEITGRSLCVFSLHAPEPYKKRVNQMLDFISTFSGDLDLIIGGDFNLTTGVRHPQEKLQDSALWLLDRLRKEFNLMSCWQAANPNQDLPQTLRWSGDKTLLFHCDGIFMPAHWYRYLDNCEVLDSPIWERRSDHNPVVATLCHNCW